MLRLLSKFSAFLLPTLAAALSATIESILQAVDDRREKGLIPALSLSTISNQKGESFSAEQKRKKKISRPTGKERASDTPSWYVDTSRPGETPRDAAARIMKERTGNEEYPTGPGSEYSKIKKNLERKPR